MEQALLELTHKIDTLTAQVAYLTEQAQAAIAADCHQAVDAALQQVFCGLEASLAGAKCGAARRPNHGPAALHDSSNRVPVESANLCSAVDHPLVAFIDSKDLGPTAERCAHHRSKCGRSSREHPHRW